MAITFISGKPGGGKSLLAVKLIAEELQRTQRTVVTNVSLKLDALNEYLAAGKGPPVDVLRRVRIIDRDELSTFWCHRGRAQGEALEPWTDLPAPDCSKTGRGETDFRANPGPVFYVLDEIHTAFNARAWMQTGIGATWYTSQHRKLGDDIVLISQNPEQVDKQLRMLSQDWVYVTNLGRLKMLALFALPTRIMATTFAGPKGPGQPVQSFHTYAIPSPGLADCYDTGAGVGLLGGGLDADRNRKKSGLSLWLLPIVAALFVILLLQIPRAFSAVGSWFIASASTVGPRVEKQAQQSLAAMATPQPHNPEPPRAVTPPPLPVPEPSPQEPPPTVSAWVKIGHRITVFLSDSSQHSMPGSLLSFVPGSHAILADGRKLTFKDPAATPSPGRVKH